jgi:hypothetical protein
MKDDRVTQRCATRILPLINHGLEGRVTLVGFRHPSKPPRSAVNHATKRSTDGALRARGDHLFRTQIPPSVAFDCEGLDCSGYSEIKSEAGLKSEQPDASGVIR